METYFEKNSFLAKQLKIFLIFSDYDATFQDATESLVTKLIMHMCCLIHLKTVSWVSDCYCVLSISSSFQT